MNVEKRLRTSIKTITILSIASAAAISACSGPGGNQRGSQSKYAWVTMGRNISLPEDSSETLALVARVLTSDMRLLSDDAADESATSLPFFVGLRGPFTKTPCRNVGGNIEMIKFSTSISHSRVDDSTNQFQASQSFTVKANSCKVNLQSDLPDTAIVGGSVDVVASSSGSVSSKQLDNSDKFPFDTDAELKLSGNVDISFEWNGTPLPNAEIQFGDFRLKFRATRQMAEEMLEIHSNPLGTEQAAQQMKDYLSENILCSGFVILRGEVYPCEDFGKYVIDVLVNKKYGLE